MSTLFAAIGPPDPDAGLSRRLKCRENGAFEDLLDRYQGPIYGFVFRLLDDPADAPDVTQDIFLKVFRKIDDFRGECTLKTWIYRIAVREASNRRRWFSRHRRNIFSLDALDTGSAWERVQDPGRSPFDVLSDREELSLIDEALHEVDERLRSAVVLRDLQGMSYGEVAATLDISLGTVKSRILRGREALRANIQKRLTGADLSGAQAQAE